MTRRTMNTLSLLTCALLACSTAVAIAMTPRQTLVTVEISDDHMKAVLVKVDEANADRVKAWEATTERHQRAVESHESDVKQYDAHVALIAAGEKLKPAKPPVAPTPPVEPPLVTVESYVSNVVREALTPVVVQYREEVVKTSIATACKSKESRDRLELLIGQEAVEKLCGSG